MSESEAKQAEAKSTVQKMVEKAEKKAEAKAKAVANPAVDPAYAKRLSDRTLAGQITASKRKLDAGDKGAQAWYNVCVAEAKSRAKRPNSPFAKSAKEE